MAKYNLKSAKLKSTKNYMQINREFFRSELFLQSILFVLFVCCLIWSLKSCDIVSHDEVASVVSPDGNYQCIVFERNGGATTSFSYWLFLRSKKAKKGSFAERFTPEEQIASLYGACRSEQAYGVNVKWINTRTIQIECLSSGESELFTPVKLEGNEFRVLLKQGILDPTAPAGGMFYNLQKNHNP